VTDMQALRKAVDDLDRAITDFELRAAEAGAYMPAVATRLRIYADGLADKYPDDSNGGRL
jgi:hypothetical protein